MKAVVAEAGHAFRAGDVYMLNAPYGGARISRITVVTPVMSADGARPLFFVASRGHHADVGGISPGSMSPNARTIEEEGCYIDCVKLVSGGRFLEDETRALLTGARYPARNPDQNFADLKAQVAANAQGEAQIRALSAECGIDTVLRYMAHVQAHAEDAVRRALTRLKDGPSKARPTRDGLCDVR